MAFPNPFYVKLPGNLRLKIENALCMTMRPVLTHTGAMRRDLINAAKIGTPHMQAFLLNAAQTTPEVVSEQLSPNSGATGQDDKAIIANYPIVGVAQKISSAGTNTQNLVQPLSLENTQFPAVTPLNGAQTVDATTVDSLYADSDDITHTASRPDPILKTIVEYWDALTPGLAQAMLGTPSMGTYDVTVPSNQTLIVGQKLTANTAFPDGAIIVAIKQRTEIVDSATATDYFGTTITLSHKAGASTAEIFQFQGANRVGWHWADEENAGGSEIRLCI